MSILFWLTGEQMARLQPCFSTAMVASVLMIDVS